MCKLNWYASDFETDTTHNDSTFVWAWGIRKVVEDIDKEPFYYGTDITSFMAKTLELGGTYWFHNEKFDGSFILNFLLVNGFSYTDKSSFDMPDFSYNVICNSMGQIYKISYKVNNKLIKIQNSLLKIPGTIKQIAKSLKLDVQKGEIDYSKYREEGANDLDPIDKDYLQRDVDILAKALWGMHLANGHTAMTIGSDCMKAYKSLNKNYKRLFENKLTKEMDEFIRRSYRGGYVYCKPMFQNQLIKKHGFTIDKNSMYPGVMHSKSRYLFPYGEPKYFKGSYVENKEYPIYVARILVTAKLKEGRWPTINLKFGMTKTGHSEYATELINQELVLTDVDLLWLHKNYEVSEYTELDGYMFKAGSGFFDSYIDTYMKLKEESTVNKDPVKRHLAKLMLNNLYGKFGTNPIRYSKVPVMHNGVLKWLPEKEYWKLRGMKEGVVYLRKFNRYKNTGYIPVATFCTAYARNELWKAMEILWEYFLYCDTDSLHCLMEGWELLNSLDIHKTKLGAWAIESKWSIAKYIRAKTYAELIYSDGEKVNLKKLNWDWKACGMPDNIKEYLNINDFEINNVWLSSQVIRDWIAKGDKRAFVKGYKFVPEAKLIPKQVRGGVILIERPFKISE